MFAQRPTSYNMNAIFFGSLIGTILLPVPLLEAVQFGIENWSAKSTKQASTIVKWDLNFKRDQKRFQPPGRFKMKLSWFAHEPLQWHSRRCRRVAFDRLQLHVRCHFSRSSQRNGCPQVEPQALIAAAATFATASMPGPQVCWTTRKHEFSESSLSVDGGQDLQHWYLYEERLGRRGPVVLCLWNGDGRSWVQTTSRVHACHLATWWSQQHLHTPICGSKHLGGTLCSISDWDDLLHGDSFAYPWHVLCSLDRRTSRSFTSSQPSPTVPVSSLQSSMCRGWNVFFRRTIYDWCSVSAEFVRSASTTFHPTDPPFYPCVILSRVQVYRKTLCRFHVRTVS